MTEQVDWRAKQPSQMVCVSEDLKCWRPWDTTCGHKASDVTPSIAWRRGVERVLRSTRRERATVNQTDAGIVYKATLGKLLIEWGTFGLFRAHSYDLKLHWTSSHRYSRYTMPTCLHKVWSLVISHTTHLVWLQKYQWYKKYRTDIQWRFEHDRDLHRKHSNQTW